jgi:hypothetical protein
MKKLLLAITLIFTFGLHASAQVCTPQTVSAPGIFPDSATNFMPAFQGTPYSQLITVRVPADTTIIPGLPAVPIDKVVLTSLSGLPQGLSYACVPSNCEFPGGQTNCAIITGTTNDPVGDYPLNIVVTPHVGGSPVAPSTLTYYKIVVNPPASIQETGGRVFSVQQNIPNPAYGKTRIDYLVPVSGEVQFRLINAIGNEVMFKRLNATSGENFIEINADQLAAGIYFYSITQGSRVMTKKLSVVK